MTSRTHPSYPPLQSPIFPVSWDDADRTYKPLMFTAVDGEVMTLELAREISEQRNVTLVNGYPRNPMGRTGYCGRGIFTRFGPNQVVHTIISRVHPETLRTEVILVPFSPDGGAGRWELPCVEDGEDLFHHDTSYPQEPKSVIVYKGYVDDPRNTDWAWVETTVYHFHNNITDDLLKSIPEARWVDIESDYCSSNEFVRMAFPYTFAFTNNNQ
jgi:hypothetical protein